MSFPETRYEVSPGSVIPSASLSLGKEMPLTGTFVSFQLRNPLVGCLFFSLVISLEFQINSLGIFHKNIFKLLPSLKDTAPFII